MMPVIGTLAPSPKDTPSSAVDSPHRRIWNLALPRLQNVIESAVGFCHDRSSLRASFCGGPVDTKAGGIARRSFTHTALSLPGPLWG